MKTLRKNNVGVGIVSDRELKRIGQELSRSTLLQERYDFVEAHPDQLLTHEDVFGTV